MTLRIAAFDSGVGGLTALAPLFKNSSNIAVTYLGDLANLPYGSKSSTRIQDLTEKNIGWLLSKSQESKQGFDLCVIACNTASAYALRNAKRIGKKFKTPVVGVIEPGCQAALKSQSKSIVVLATSATVSTQIYTQNLKKLNRALKVTEKACPLFVHLVEENLQKSPAAQWIAQHYLSKHLNKKTTAILGCTHYPFLLPTLQKLFPKVEWIDAGGALLKDPLVSRLLQKKRAPKESKLTVYLTDKSTDLNRLKQFLKQSGLEKIQLKLKYIPSIL